MGVKILVDSDVELDNERVESRAVGASGEQYGTCGEIERRAYRKESRYRLLQLFKPKSILQPSLHVAREYSYLPCCELVGVARLRDSLRDAYKQKFLHGLVYSVGARGDEAIRGNVGGQLIERLQHFLSGEYDIAHGQSGIGLNIEGTNILA